LRKAISVCKNQRCGSGRGSWKRLNFSGSGSTLKKEAGSGSKKYSAASTSLGRFQMLVTNLLIVLGVRDVEVIDQQIVKFAKAEENFKNLHHSK